MSKSAYHLVYCYCEFFSRTNCSVYEIYPQSETSHLTRIAHLDVDFILTENHYLVPDTVFWFLGLGDRIVFWVWDYRLNHSINFSVDVDFYREFEVYFILSKSLKLISNSFVGR